MRCENCKDLDALTTAVIGSTGSGSIATAPSRRKLSPSEATAAALAIWNGSRQALGSPAAVYLAERGLAHITNRPVLQFRRDCRHPDERGFWPSLVALVTDVNDRPLAVHRTYLRADGTWKAQIPVPRASKGPIWGGAIRLDPVSPELVIGEGLETAASAGLIFGLPAWAAISCGNLATGLMLPAEVRRIVIAADPEATGRNAARNAWRRWTGEGRVVRIATPDGKGDFNDLLLGRDGGCG